MSQFTVVANTSSHVLYLDIGNIAAIKLFAELINEVTLSNKISMH